MKKTINKKKKSSKTHVRTKSKVKLKGRKRKYSESLKSRSVISSPNSTATLNQRLKRGKASAVFKKVKKNKDGTYTLEQGRDGGNFTSKIISAAKAMRIKKQMNKK